MPMSAHWKKKGKKTVLKLVCKDYCGNKSDNNILWYFQLCHIRLGGHWPLMVSDIPRGVRSDATHQTEATYICLHHKMFTEKVISCGCKWGIANNTVETERERERWEDWGGRLVWKFQHIHWQWPLAGICTMHKAHWAGWIKCDNIDVLYNVCSSKVRYPHKATPTISNIAANCPTCTKQHIQMNLVPDYQDQNRSKGS